MSRIQHKQPLTLQLSVVGAATPDDEEHGLIRGLKRGLKRGKSKDDKDGDADAILEPIEELGPFDYPDAMGS